MGFTAGAILLGLVLMTTAYKLELYRLGNALRIVVLTGALFSGAAFGEALIALALYEGEMAARAAQPLLEHLMADVIEAARPAQP